MSRMADMEESQETSAYSNDDLPGEPLDTGFRFRDARSVPEAQLSRDARERVLAKMDSVDEARLRAAKEGQTAYVG
jgi:hypothetical protein